MNKESGSVSSVIEVSVKDEKDISINEICEEKERDIKNRSRVATLGMGTDYVRSFMPLLAMASMMLEPYGIFENSFAGAGARFRELLRVRKCALTECDIHFTPAKSSETCCSKDHFFILKKRQKEQREKK